jgi:membrane protein
VNLSKLLDTLPGRVLQKFLEDQAPNWAVIIAWNGLFAMFPILIFAAALLGLALGTVGFATVFYHAISYAIPDTKTVVAVEDAVSNLEKQSGLLLLIGVLGLLWGGSALFGSMEQAFAVIYHTRPRDFIPQKLLSILMILVFTGLAGFAVVTSAILPALQSIPEIPKWVTHGIGEVLIQFIAGSLAGSVLFTTIYFVVPNRKQELHKVWPGGVLAGVCFELVSLLFPFYVSVFNPGGTYGGFALLFVVLTFFFFLGLITMVGVELNSVLYPVPIQLPGKDAHVVAPPESGPDGEGKLAKARDRGAPSDPDGRVRDRRGIPTAAALGMAVVASVLGVIVGRRSGGND